MLINYLSQEPVAEYALYAPETFGYADKQYDPPTPPYPEFQVKLDLLVLVDLVTIPVAWVDEYLVGERKYAVAIVIALGST